MGEWEEAHGLSGSYTDEQWAMTLEVARQIGVEDGALRRESPHANRNVILAALGYSEAWSVDQGLMGLVQVWFTSCGRCGATIKIEEAKQGRLAPIDQHTWWHLEVEGVAPNGRRREQEGERDG